MANEGLVHQHQRGAARNFALVPQAAAEDWDLQSSEIFAANEFELGFLGLGGRSAHNFYGLAPAAVGRSGIGRGTSGKHPRHRRDFVPQFGIEADSIRPCCMRVIADGKNH